MSISTPNIPRIVEREIKIRTVGNFHELLRGHDSAVFKAIGYLSSWGSAEAFPRVTVNCAGDRGSLQGPEITAVYKGVDGAVGFVIGAIWHPDEGEFSFHS